MASACGGPAAHGCNAKVHKRTAVSARLAVGSAPRPSLNLLCIVASDLGKLHSPARSSEGQQRPFPDAGQWGEGAGQSLSALLRASRNFAGSRHGSLPVPAPAGGAPSSGWM